jgi:hypothetical protein
VKKSSGQSGLLSEFVNQYTSKNHRAHFTKFINELKYWYVQSMYRIIKKEFGISFFNISVNLKCDHDA